MKLLAPAKINLHLRVGPRGKDGFHPLFSWMCSVGLFDTLDIEPLESEPVESEPVESASASLVEFRCDVPAVPVDASNLVVRAAEALARFVRSDGEARSTSRRASAARANVVLTKRIPIGGGLGGGSSDAASALLGLSRLWNLNLSTSQLSSIASELGSDVPFFLHGASSICIGRGEIVAPIAVPKPKSCLLILPTISSSTPAVYRRFDEISVNAPTTGDEWLEFDLLKTWPAFSALELLPRLANDLETPAFDLHPDLRRLRASAEQILNRPVRMSGSGSSLFTLYDDRAGADQAAIQVTDRLNVISTAVDLAPGDQRGDQRGNPAAAKNLIAGNNSTCGAL